MKYNEVYNLINFYLILFYCLKMNIIILYKNNIKNEIKLKYKLKNYCLEQ